MTLVLSVSRSRVFAMRMIPMTIYTSWTNMATMSFPFQPQIPYRAAAHVRRPLKSSIHPASEGSRRLVQYFYNNTVPHKSFGTGNPDCTVLKFQDFYITVILCEIIFEDSRGAKSAVFAILGAVNFVQLVNFSLQRVQKVIVV